MKPDDASEVPFLTYDVCCAFPVAFPLAEHGVEADRGLRAELATWLPSVWRQSGLRVTLRAS